MRLRKTAFFLLGMVLVFALAGTFWLLRSLTLELLVPNRRALQDYHREILAESAEYGLQIEPREFRTADGLRLNALLVSPSDRPGKALKTRRMRNRLQASGLNIIQPNVPGTIIMLHGRGGRKEDSLPIAERFVAAGFQCLCLDLRAMGESEGSFTRSVKKKPGICAP